MKFSIKIFSYLVLFLLSTTILGLKIVIANNDRFLPDDETDRVYQELETYYKDVIDKYRDYIAKTPKKVREEITRYRSEVSKLQEKKKKLYMKLSLESQDFLKNEQKFRNKLPINKRGKIELQEDYSVSVEQSNK